MSHLFSSTGDLKQQIAALKAQLKACEDEVKTLRALANGGVPMRPQKPEWMEAATAGGRPATPAPARPGAGPPGSKVFLPLRTINLDRQHNQSLLN